MAEPVTITPHDPRKVAFRALVATLRADSTLASRIAVWDVRDGTALDEEQLEVGDHTARLTPVMERMEPVCCNGGGRRTWECPVTVQVETLVASGNIDNAVNLTGLIEGVAAELTPAQLRAMGISWLDIVTPAASPPVDGVSTSAGAFRFVVHIER